MTLSPLNQLAKSRLNIFEKLIVQIIWCTYVINWLKQRSLIFQISNIENNLWKLWTLIKLIDMNSSKDVFLGLLINEK